MGFLPLVFVLFKYLYLYACLCDYSLEMAEEIHLMSTRWMTSNSTNAEAKGLNRFNFELTEDKATFLHYFIIVYDTDVFLESFEPN